MKAFISAPLIRRAKVAQGSDRGSCGQIEANAGFLADRRSGGDPEYEKDNETGCGPARRILFDVDRRLDWVALASKVEAQNEGDRRTELCDQLFRIEGALDDTPYGGECGRRSEDRRLARDECATNG